MFSLLLAMIYVCFISLGLPDSLLGSAWPIMHLEIQAPMSSAGIISSAIFVGTILSSFFSDRLVRWLGSGKITAISTALTAIALFGFSVSTQFWMLLLWSIPYGLGAGGVDSVLNNYVALHFKPQHMSWLHCSWGVGASISPYIMSFALTKLNSWNQGYRIVSIIQISLTVIIFLSLPLWKSTVEQGTEEEESKPLRFKEIFAIPGATACVLTFFSYCSMELATALWASTYLVETRSIDPVTAASFASLFYIGITAGRAVNGFLAMRLSDRVLIRTGLGIVFVGILFILLPLHVNFALCGFAVIGVGCAPIYPCIIHMTPGLFGRDKSQAIIGIQMSFAYVGYLTMPALFGQIAEYVSIGLLPVFILVFVVLMAVMHEVVVKQAGKNL